MVKVFKQSGMAVEKPVQEEV